MKKGGFELKEIKFYNCLGKTSGQPCSTVTSDGVPTKAWVKNMPNGFVNAKLGESDPFVTEYVQPCTSSLP